MKCQCQYEVGDSPCDIHDALTDDEGILHSDAKIAAVVKAAKEWREAISNEDETKDARWKREETLEKLCEAIDALEPAK